MSEKELEEILKEVLEASKNYYSVITEKIFRLRSENKDFLNKAYKENESIRALLEEFE